MPIDPRSVQWDQPQMTVPVGPRNPRLPAQVQGDVLGNIQTATQTRKTAQDIALDPRRVAVAEGQLANSRQNTSIEAAKQALAQQQAMRERAASLAPLKAMDKQIRTVWDLYARGPGKTKGLAGISDYLPSDANSAFDAAAAGLGELGRNAFRTPGMGAQSDTELRAFIDANQPSSWGRDAATEQKLKNLENRLAEQFKAYGLPYTPYRPKGFGAPSSNGGAKIIRFDAKGNRIP